MTRARFVKSGLLIWWCAVYSAQAYHLYELVPLGHLGGGSSRASAINDRGWVVGESESASGEVRAFLWKPGAEMQSLGTLDGPGSRAHDISRDGNVAGESLDSNGVVSAFVWTEAGGMRALPVPAHAIYSAAFAVSDEGVVVGSMEDERGVHAVAWRGEAMQLLHRLPGAGNVQPLDINDQGDVVGHIAMGSGEEQASLAFYFPGGVRAENLADFRLISAQSGSAAVAVNERGFAAGYVMLDSARVRAFRTVDEGKLELLPDREALFSTATDLNGQAMVTGSRVAYFAADESACLWRDGRCFDLNEVTRVDDDDWWLVQGMGINAAGEIAGYGMHGEFNEAFVLRPIPGARPAAWPQVDLRIDQSVVDGDIRMLVLRAGVPEKLEVSAVAFYAEDQLLGVVDVPPFEWGWEGPHDQDVSFHAVMKESSGRTTASPRIAGDDD